MHALCMYVLLECNSDLSINEESTGTGVLSFENLDKILIIIN